MSKNQTTDRDLIDDARDMIATLHAWPEMPDIEGRVTARGTMVLGRVQIVFTSVVDRLEELVNARG